MTREEWCDEKAKEANDWDTVANSRFENAPLEPWYYPVRIHATVLRTFVANLHKGGTEAYFAAVGAATGGAQIFNKRFPERKQSVLAAEYLALVAYVDWRERCGE